MKKTLFILALLAPMLVLVSGCQTDHGAYLPANANTNNLEDISRFVALDHGAANAVTCPGIEESHLPDGRLQVQANVRNRENRRIQVQINCVFKDAQGFPVDETPFRNLFLDENAEEGVQFVCANDKATRYTVRVREAR